MNKLSSVDNWLGETSWLAFQNEPVLQNELTDFQLTSCNGEAISTEYTTDDHVGFKIIQNNVPTYKQASSSYVITH